MPTQKYQLTWMESTNRWRKKFRGQIHYFPLLKGETMKSSYRRCLAEWEARRKQLLEQEPKETREQRAYRTAIHKWRQMRDWFAKGLDGEQSQQGYDEAEQMIAKLQRRLKQGALPQLERHEEDPLYGVSEAGKWVWMDREKQMQAHGKPVAGTLAGIADDFIKVKLAQVEADERSAARYDAIRCHLEKFRDWAGGHRPIADLTYDLLEAYHTHILKLSRSEISKHTARDRMQSVKQFAFYAARRKLIPPILFNVQDFSFRLTAQKIKTVDIDTVKRLLAASTDRTRLYLLLMLNTGMTQKDISDLKQDQVDWEKGTIRRKRSKTKHQDGVPEVEYALWPETFELLKEHRSSDASRVLLNKQGGSLFEQSIKANGKLKKTDNIKSAFSRVARKLNITTVTLKQFRATSATILNKHGDYHRLTQHFLGQSPRTIADRHYVVQSQELFDKAVKWLRKQYGIS